MAETHETICPKCSNGSRSQQRLIDPVERRELSDKVRTQANLLRGTIHVCEVCKGIYIKHWRGLLSVGYLKIVGLAFQSVE
jgi:hypothetical protein